MFLKCLSYDMNCEFMTLDTRQHAFPSRASRLSVAVTSGADVRGASRLQAWALGVMIDV